MSENDRSKTESGADSIPGLKPGNRKVVTDFFIDKKENSLIQSEEKNFQYKIFVRLNAKEITFRKISFEHCIFENCYLTHCVFDSCNFTGCRFIGSNFHRSSFNGCNFEFATFERSQIDSDIFSEAPKKENLKMRFARSLRMNYQQIGDAKAVNKAISLELEATSVYLLNSWKSDETYYKTKYPGLLNGIIQFAKWLEFWTLELIWGNGESILKLLRSMLISILLIAIYDTNTKGGLINFGFHLDSLEIALSSFLGVSHPSNFSNNIISLITGVRFIAISLLTALLVKRFSRR